MIEGNNPPQETPPLPPSARQDPKAAQIVQEALTRGKAHASPVGIGIARPGGHKQYVAPGVAATKVPDEVKLDNGWSDKAALKDQVSRGPEYWKLDKVEVQIFDLSNDERLKAYNEILTKANQPDTNVVLVQNKQEFSEKTGNWMAMVELQYILYRKILITEKNQDEKAS